MRGRMGMRIKKRRIIMKTAALSLAAAMLAGGTSAAYAAGIEWKNLDLALLLEEAYPIAKEIKEAAEAAEALKITDITKFTVELDKYMVMADGKEATPKVLSVSGEANIQGESGEYTPGQLTLAEDDYDVKYYRVESFSEEIYEAVDKIDYIGEYRIEIIPKDSERFKGKASCLFSVIGRQQHVMVEKTSYRLRLTSEAPKLMAVTDGGGLGFEFRSTDEEILTVSESGQVELNKPGRAYVIISTVGDRLYQPATVRILFEITPAKVSWDSKNLKAKKDSITPVWKKQTGATSYEIMYSTSKSFEADVMTETVSGTKTKATLKKPQSGKSCYVKIRALTETTDTRGNIRILEGPWSAVKKL